MVYKTHGRSITIPTELATKYSETVCPISEHMLVSFIMTLGKNCTDNELSKKIETDLIKEIAEYEY